MGPGEKNATKEDIDCAYEVGKIVANTGSVLLCGGMTGVMEASAMGAHENGGIVLGISPTMEKKDMNKFVDIPVVTGMSSGRNFINILSSDILVFISVRSPGTLSELAHAVQQKKNSFVIRANEHLQNYISEVDSSSVKFLENASTLEEELKSLLKS